ncbi:hypothetical protein UFOVP239_25 [uncultured Caudovirales phage]|uniref:Uncharacterized protein n=1 Tax=uncultured Caudovirales phage TaxID=2100421 RepID=A0A6J7WV62_9CAUD|nr:hypothetical protein UFOVP239_25 [uncultured Caudovirales phage]
MRFRKKQTIEATQWNGHGDHPEVKPATMKQAAGVVPGLLWEHAGWLGTNPGRVVAPGNWLIKSSSGMMMVYDNELFEKLYVAVQQEDE